jgi:dTDP-4-dehydrorhamnose 3,5-epimerase
MNIVKITDLPIPDIKVIRFNKHSDFRGYFSETFNTRDIKTSCPFLNDYSFVQSNESFSFANTFRGMHHQANMGKLVRLIYGKLIDFSLDLRQNSDTYYQIIGYELESTCDYAEWIWIPPGIAHGMWLQENSMVEYFCTKLYDSTEEHNIPIFSKKINWNICDKNIYTAFHNTNIEALKIKTEDLVER